MTSSARRHGVDGKDIDHGVRNAVRLIETDDGLFIIGAGTFGQLLELIARPVKTGELSTVCAPGSRT